jgi:hypothetical protein
MSACFVVQLANIFCSAEFYILLTVQLSMIIVNDKLDAQVLFLYIYFNSVHVSSKLVLIVRRLNCINTTSGMCHSV